MLAAEKIDAIARDAALKYLKSDAVEGVTSKDAFDSEGRDAVRITIMLKANAARRLEGDAVLDALVAIKSKLHEAGEERTSIVEYAETGEAVEADDGDSQS